MYTANQTVVLAGYYLAPARPSPTPTSLSAQFHYALSSWSPGGLMILVGILAFLVLMTAVVKRRAQRQ